MNDAIPIDAKSEPSDDTLLAARQLILEVLLDEAETRIITLENLTFHGLPLGSWVVTIHQKQ